MLKTIVAAMAVLALILVRNLGIKKYREYKQNSGKK